MKDTLFLQFYHKHRTSFGNTVYCYNNGFSETWDLCKERGDFFWLDLKLSEDSFDDSDIAYFHDTELPIQSGTIYASCFYVIQLYWLVILAKKYPQIEFIVGGPVNGYISNSLPKNLKIFHITVENLFGVPQFSGKWNLEFPELNQNPNDLNMITYPIDDRCYWSKCIFCTYSLEHRCRPEYDWKFAGLTQDLRKWVLIYTPSMSEKHLNIIESLPDRHDIEYIYYIRADVHKKLDRVFSKLKRTDNHTLACGLDSTTNRMLKYINKGLTIQDYIDLVKVLAKYDCKIVFTTILGWPNLTEKDVVVTKGFLDQLRDIYPDVTIKVNKLISKPERSLIDFDSEYKYKIGDFYCGYIPYLNSKQLELNNKILYEFKKFPNVNDNYTNMVRKVL